MSVDFESKNSLTNRETDLEISTQHLNSSASNSTIGNFDQSNLFTQIYIAQKQKEQTELFNIVSDDIIHKIASSESQTTPETNQNQVSLHKSQTLMSRIKKTSFNNCI